MSIIVFDEFLSIIKDTERPLAAAIDELFMTNNCKRDIKESASGYTVSYIYNKKTLANFVCRKTGLKIRLTPPKPFDCNEFIATMPENMKKDMMRANACKRLSGENVCNPRCAMGYSFTIDGAKYDKCRSMAFLYSVTDENINVITNIIRKALS